VSGAASSPADGRAKVSSDGSDPAAVLCGPAVAEESLELDQPGQPGRGPRGIGELDVEGQGLRGPARGVREQELPADRRSEGGRFCRSGPWHRDDQRGLREDEAGRVDQPHAGRGTAGHIHP